MPTRRLYALLGVVATLVGMAVGHLAASLISKDSSPVLAVGATVVDSTPTPVKEWAIRTFDTDGVTIGPFDFPAGNYDKQVLIGSVLIGVLVLAGVAGVLTRRSFRAGGAMLVALVAVAMVATALQPSVAVLAFVPGLLTGAAGLGSLWLLHRTASGLPVDPRARSTAEVAKAQRAEGAAPATRSAPGPRGSQSEQPEVLEGGPRGRGTGADRGAAHRAGSPSRRGVLLAAGALTAAAAVLGGAGRWINSIRSRPEDVALPEPAAGQTPEPLPQGLHERFDAITPLRIDNEDFYRVDTRLDTPVVDTEGWSLTIDGDVEQEVEISYEELLAMPMVERDITMTCVSNSVGGQYVGGARWLGVPLNDVLALAGVGSTADQILSTDFDGMTISTPLEVATDGRPSLIAVGMNGEPLPRAHGFPVRMVVPGLYGFVGSTKWVTRLTLTTYAEQQAYWTKRDWATDAPVKPSARIDTPGALESVSGDEVIVGGVAWAQADGGVKKVQVQLEGGRWLDAEMGPPVNNVYWRQWFYRWQNPEPGRRRVAARVVDDTGDVQTAAQAQPFPSGSSGYHSIIFTVA